MSNFAFLQSEWPSVYESAAKAESLVYPDPRAACFYARRALELAVQWLYRAEAKLTLPYQDTLAALLWAAGLPPETRRFRWSHGSSRSR